MPWLTIFGLFLSTAVFLGAVPFGEDAGLWFAFLALVVGVSSFLGSILFFGALLGPLTKVETEIGPTYLLRSSWQYRFLKNVLFFFPWFSFLLPAGVILGFTSSLPLFLIWVVAFGIYLDALRWGWQWGEELLNPETMIQQLLHRAKWAIQNEKDEVLWSSLDGMGEVALKAIQQHHLSLCSHAIDGFPSLVSIFFASSKSISRKPMDDEIQKETGSDEASYTLFYLLQRLQWIYQKAVLLSMEAVGIHLIRVLGKITISCMQFDFSLVAPPLRFLSRFGVQAERVGWEDASRLAVSTLLELAKKMVEDFDVRWSGLQEPFFALIQGLDDLARTAFQKDRSTTISLLLSPFFSIQNILKQDRLAGQVEIPAIQAKLDTVITQFQTLEQLLRHPQSPQAKAGE